MLDKNDPTRVFHVFGQAKSLMVVWFSSQFSLLSKLFLKIAFALKVVKFDSKIIISLQKSNCGLFSMNSFKG